MKNETLSDLIKKYLAGNGTEAEKKALDDWYAHFEEEPNVIDSLSTREQTQLKENLLGQIKNNIRETEATQEDVQAAKIIQMPVLGKQRNWVNELARIAAMLLIACGLGFMTQRYWNQPEPAQEIVAQTLFNNTDKKAKKVVLPDGSKVWLQEKSSLLVAHDFGKTKRQVTLKGEAFFDVAKDKKRPFEIYSGKVTTRVLGTSFNIKAYEKDATVEVSVVTGKVSVLTPGADKAGETTDKGANTVILMPNQKITYSKEIQNLVKKEVSTQGRRLVWAKTSLSFENKSIREVVKVLNENFATNITLANEDINNCSIQGDFTNQNLPEILEVICKSIEADYELYKDQIVINGAGCPSNNKILP